MCKSRGISFQELKKKKIKCRGPVGNVSVRQCNFNKVSKRENRRQKVRAVAIGLTIGLRVGQGGAVGLGPVLCEQRVPGGL